MSNLLSPEQLKGLLDDPQLRVIDARHVLGDPEAGRRAWQAAHIPGAVHLDLARDLSASAGEGGRHPLPPVTELSETFGRAGIGADSRVVVYDEETGMFASRVWWTLRYLGFDAVQVLDGGIRAWQAAGYPLSDEAAEYSPREFPARPRPEMVAGRAEVQDASASGRGLLIDSRSAERYRGENETMDSRAGHIPGAVNYPYSEVLADGRLKPVAELSRHFAGLNRADSQIVYCGSGVSATLNLLALAEAGLPLPRLYVGSWSDWSSSPEAPVASG